MSNKHEAWKDEPFAGCENPEVPMGKWLLDNAPKPSRLLDVGCGTGIHTRWFNSQGIDAHGITINHNEIARRVHQNVGFGDMCEIPFPDASFDCVFALGSLEHTFTPFHAIMEFRRVLSVGGTLYLDMPNIYNMEIMDPAYWYHKSVLFPIQVCDLLAKAGFDLIIMKGTQKIDKTMYTADSSAHYLASRTDRVIRW